MPRQCLFPTCKETKKMCEMYWNKDMTPEEIYYVPPKKDRVVGEEAIDDDNSRSSNMSINSKTGTTTTHRGGGSCSCAGEHNLCDSCQHCWQDYPTEVLLPHMGKRVGFSAQPCMTWCEARKACTHYHGGHLWEPRSKDEFDFVVKKLEKLSVTKRKCKCQRN